MTLIEVVDGIEVWETANGVAYIKDGVLLNEEQSVTILLPNSHSMVRETMEADIGETEVHDT